MLDLWNVYRVIQNDCRGFNPLTANDLYISRTTPLTSKRCILYIYSTNIGTEYFKHALYSPFFSLQNAVCIIMLTSLVSVLFTFYLQDVPKLKKNNSSAKGLKLWPLRFCFIAVNKWWSFRREFLVRSRNGYGYFCYEIMCHVNLSDRPHTWKFMAHVSFVLNIIFVSKSFRWSKVKCTLVQALRLCTGRTAHRGSRGIALLFLGHCTRRGWGFSVTPRPLFTLGKDPVPIVQEAGWAPGAGLDMCGKSLPHRDSIAGPSSP